MRLKKIVKDKFFSFVRVALMFNNLDYKNKHLVPQVNILKKIIKEVLVPQVNILKKMVNYKKIYLLLFLFQLIYAVKN